jgi:hypothetical protein
MRVQNSEFQLKKRSIVMLLIAGACASAFAQAPALSLPSLPSLPDAKSGDMAALPSLPTVSLPKVGADTPALPTIAGLTKAAEPVKGSATPLVLKGTIEELAPAVDSTGLTPLPLPATTLPDVKVDAIATPNNALPLPPAMPTASAQPTSMAVNGDASGTKAGLTSSASLSDKPAVKTWKTRLAPTSTDLKTRYNYKRTTLPDVLYRPAYNASNKHLPLRVTHDDYAGLLFNSVAHNDVDATRALLNTGVSVQAINPYGETPLMLAHRMGAMQVAALLVARGAR